MHHKCKQFKREQTKNYRFPSVRLGMVHVCCVVSLMQSSFRRTYVPETSSAKPYPANDITIFIFRTHLTRQCLIFHLLRWWCVTPHKAFPRSCHNHWIQTVKTLRIARQSRNHRKVALLTFFQFRKNSSSQALAKRRCVDLAPLRNFEWTFSTLYETMLDSATTIPVSKRWQHLRRVR